MSPEISGDPDTEVQPVDVDGANVGVPVVPGSPREPQGPEDALGSGPKRGDYRDRQPENTVHTRQVAIPDSELKRDSVGNIVDQPRMRTEVQNVNVHDIGDVPGKKGGVN
jgi:hypothetical protein